MAGTLRVPGYRVDELLGAGSSGEVWRGRMRSTGAAVALKRLPVADESRRRAAVAEAAVLSALDHAHLVRLYEVVRLDDAIVLVLDLADGGSLGQLLAARHRLTAGETITALAPVAAAVAHAHAAGVVHGDISPANVLFTASGVPLLTDLGVARLLGDTQAVRTTPAYADPAVAAGYLPGPESDVFMLGAVALHALAGAPPWSGPDAAAVLAVAAAAESLDVEAPLAAADVPIPVAKVVRRALSLDPSRRGTAAEFALDLRASGHPVAVELSAGRARAAVPVVDPGSSSVVVGGEPAFTRGVRLPSALDRPVGRHRVPHLPPAPPRRLVVAAAALGLATSGALLGWHLTGRGHDGTAAAAPTPHPAAAVPRPASPTASPSASPTASPRPAPVRQGAPPSPVRQVLAELDARRASAFAHRNPSALADVYASRVLLARDQALLRAAVPVGCGLAGAHTRYTSVDVVARHGAETTVRVTASLPGSTLVCGGDATQRVDPVPSRRLQIVLVHGPGGDRIAGQEVLAQRASAHRRADSTS